MNLRPLPCEGSALPLSYPPVTKKNSMTGVSVSKENLSILMYGACGLLASIGRLRRGSEGGSRSEEEA